MSLSAGFPAGGDAARHRRVALLLIFLLIAARLICAAMLPLAFDETYYWLWSKHLAAGYLDHPPMIALVIRAGTSAFGDTSLGVRLFCVLLGVPATWAVWRAGATLFSDERIGATAALYFNLTLMVGVGTILATIDAPLIAASAFVVYTLAKVARERRGVWWLAVGVSVGCALLSKYSALFFGAGILIWLAWTPQERRWLVTPWPWLGGVVALLLFAPVIAWNAEHGWVSFIKQFGRAAEGGWSADYLPEYLGAQFGLLTPPLFTLAAMGLAAFWRGRGADRTARVLLSALICPPLIYFTWHSLHARVEGNWTAPIFPALALTAAAGAHQVDWHGAWKQLADWSRRLAAPVGVGFFAVVCLQAMFGLAPIGAESTARKLGAGWETAGREIDAVRKQVGAPAVLTTSYAMTGWLSFYLPSRPPVVQVNERIRWVNAPAPPAALFRGPLLYVCDLPCNDQAPVVRSRYEKFEQIKRVSRRWHGIELETYGLFRVEGLRGDPLDRSTVSVSGR
jgi:4-amino-4-deoxy-L-arabinose transferase-like glycosyltransferase